MTESVYQSCFDLIHTYIYGGVTMTPDMNLVCTEIATIASIFLFSLPFLVVYFVLRTISSFSFGRF